MSGALLTNSLAQGVVWLTEEQVRATLRTTHKYPVKGVDVALVAAVNTVPATREAWRCLGGSDYRERIKAQDHYIQHHPANMYMAPALMTLGFEGVDCLGTAVVCRRDLQPFSREEKRKIEDSFYSFLL